MHQNRGNTKDEKQSNKASALEVMLSAGALLSNSHTPSTQESRERSSIHCVWAIVWSTGVERLNSTGHLMQFRFESAGRSLLAIVKMSERICEKSTFTDTLVLLKRLCWLRGKELDTSQFYLAQLYR